MKTVKFFFLLAAVAGTSLPLFAGNGSIYSTFGVGDIINYGGIRSFAMGGTGIASLADGTVNELNPAGLGQLTRTQYAGEVQYQGYSMSDGTASTFLSSGNFQSAALAFPVYSEYGIGFAFSVTPFSRRAYDVIDKESNPGITQTFTGSGGLSSAQFGFSFSPVQDLYFGVTTHYLFGNFDDVQEIEYDSLGYFTTNGDKNISTDGFAFTVGGLFSGLDKALGISKEKHLNIGATFFSGATLKSDGQIFQNFSTVADTTDSISTTTKIPLGFALGLEYDVRNNFVLTGDFQYQQWSRYTYMGVHPPEIQNSMRVGVGAEFLPTRSLSEPYYRQVTYRVGGYMDQSYLKLNGQAIDDYFITGGISVPVFSTPGSEARLNIGLEHGIRGTTSNGLERDAITRVTVSLTGSDTWFIVPEVQ